MLDRVGFLFEQYTPDYLFWDVLETVRKLYLVTVVWTLTRWVWSCVPFA